MIWKAEKQKSHQSFNGWPSGTSLNVTQTDALDASSLWQALTACVLAADEGEDGGAHKTDANARLFFGQSIWLAVFGWQRANLGRALRAPQHRRSAR